MTAGRERDRTTVEEPGAFSHIELYYALEISLRKICLFNPFLYPPLFSS